MPRPAPTWSRRTRVAAAIAIPLLVGRVGSMCVYGAPDVTAGIYQDALRRITEKDPGEFTLAKASSKEWFPGSWEFYRHPASAFNSQKLGDFVRPNDVHVSDASHRKVLSLAGSGAQQGDIVVVYSLVRRIVLVYAGERTFPDAPSGKKYSFFVYPYTSRVEYNTFPPRLHRQLYEHLTGKKKTPPLTKSTTWSRATMVAGAKKSERGVWHWYRAATNPTKTRFVPSTTWDDDPVVRVFRPKHVFVHIKRPHDMLCHKQTKTKACFFQALSDAWCYQHPHSGSQSRDPRAVEHAFMQKYLLSTDYTSDDTLKQMLTATGNWKKIQVPTPTTYRPQLASALKFSGYRPQGPPPLDKDILYPIAYWTFISAVHSRMKSHLHLALRYCSTEAQLAEFVEKSLTLDRPVMVRADSREIVPVSEEEEHRLPPQYNDPYVPYYPPDDLNATPAMGHFLTVIGMRRYGGTVYYYYQDGLRVGDGIVANASFTDAAAHVVKMKDTQFWKLVNSANMTLDNGQSVPNVFVFVQ